jgi:putative membrane protein
MVTRWVPGFAWVLVQVVLVTLGLLVLGVQAAAWPALIGVLLLTGAAFLSIVQLLKAILGGGGHLVALALLVLQIVASGAIFPIQTLGGFFGLLHPLMPMTYAADAVRRTIAGGPLTPFVWIDVLVLLAITFAAMGLTAYAASRKRSVSAAGLQPAITLG